jgi:hypothetical protein
MTGYIKKLYEQNGHMPALNINTDFHSSPKSVQENDWIIHQNRPRPQSIGRLFI